MDLGSFVREYEYEGAIFYVRGLTVGEYSDLAQQGLLKLNERMFVEIAVAGIMGWENIFDEGGDEVEFDNSNSAEWLPDKVLINVGKFIYHNMTQLSISDAEKFKGFIRFLYWSSEDKNESRSETYDCETCLKRGLAVSRPCGRFDMDYRMSYVIDKNKERQKKVSKERANNLNRKSKYKNKKLKKKRKARMEKHRKKVSKKDGKKYKPQTGDQLVLNKFRFPECPISWVDEWIKVLGEVMYQAEKSELPIFAGGLMDQPYQIYRASKVVKSEYSKIENEKLEEQRNK